MTYFEFAKRFPNKTSAINFIVVHLVMENTPTV